MICNLSIAETYNGFYYRNFETKEQLLLTAESTKDLILSVMLSKDGNICKWKTTIADWISMYQDQIFSIKVENTPKDMFAHYKEICDTILCGTLLYVETQHTKRYITHKYAIEGSDRYVEIWKQFGTNHLAYEIWDNNEDNCFDNKVERIDSYVSLFEFLCSFVNAVDDCLYMQSV